jgi:hypothetical protein
MDREEPLTDDSLERETERFWEDPRRIMALIDILFLGEDQDGRQVCS